jgi:hypothetical protein
MRLLLVLQQAQADRWSFEDLYYVGAFVLLIAGIAGVIGFIRWLARKPRK